MLHCTRQLLPCKQIDFYWYLVYLDCSQNAAARRAALRNRTPMSKAAAAACAPSNGSFTRLLASIDRLLAASARVSARNGDVPYFGL
jgi:hypothetical protein